MDTSRAQSELPPPPQHPQQARRSRTPTLQTEAVLNFMKMALVGKKFDNPDIKLSITTKFVDVVPPRYRKLFKEIGDEHLGVVSAVGEDAPGKKELRELLFDVCFEMEIHRDIIAARVYDGTMPSEKIDEEWYNAKARAVKYYKEQKRQWRKLARAYSEGGGGESSAAGAANPPT